MASHLANIGPVDVNADGHGLRTRVVNLVHIAHGGRDRFDLSGLEADGLTAGLPAALRILGIGLTHFFPAQHANEAPDGVVVHRCGLAGTPDKAHDGEAVFGVGVQQKLLVMLGVGLGKGLG